MFAVSDSSRWLRLPLCLNEFERVGIGARGRRRHDRRTDSLPTLAGGARCATMVLIREEVRCRVVSISMVKQLRGKLSSGYT